MRLSIKTKQVVGVTVIVGLATVLLGGWYLSSLVRVQLEESRDRAELLGNIVSQHVFTVVAAGTDPFALRDDAGLQSILAASVLDDRLQYAAIVDVNRFIIAHYDRPSIGGRLPMPTGGDLETLLTAGPIEQARTLYEGGLRTYEVSTPLLLGSLDPGGDLEEFGSVVIGFNTGLIRADIVAETRVAVYTALAAMLIAMVISVLLAQVMLRPIHVIRSGLARLGRGEMDVDVELPDDQDLGDLGDSFRALSARLASDRSELAGQKATLASVADHLEDAVAIFGPKGRLLFANAAMQQQLLGTTGTARELFPEAHPFRAAVQLALGDGTPPGPRTVTLPDGGERLAIVDRITSADQKPMGVVLVARNIAYLSQVESTLSYSRKLAALGRLSSGIAHEVKNPLNATMIHLELLRSELTDQPDAMEHLAVIRAQMRRLDEVVQGFLKFIRPEELRLTPVAVGLVVDNVLPFVRAEADKHGVKVEIDCPADVPDVHADANLLEQAFLNLALNACQAMPNGGRLAIRARRQPDHRIQITFEDTGVGISPEDLARVFDLYYTTKAEGSGIGLSLVYRTVQLHDGDIEVESVPGKGTTFRLRLPQAPENPPNAAEPAS
jgi:signal transduction histidine kinase